ncbi:hypothetical protein MKX01_032815, partial [Papaver californicum]
EQRYGCFYEGSRSRHPAFQGAGKKAYPLHYEPLPYQHSSFKTFQELEQLIAGKYYES